jgi:hypothetical protein
MIAFFTTLRNLVAAIRRGWVDPQFRALTFLVVVLLGSGTLFYWRFEGWSVLDSVYFSVITLTTVGYGDFSPETTAGKVFTIVYVLIGLGILVSFLGAVAGHAVEARVDRRRRRSGDEGVEGT